ncbi:MAG: hypothetical protein Q9186_005054 [Xanthomendoza sp. 1 TL-2023]
MAICCGTFILKLILLLIACYFAWLLVWSHVENTVYTLEGVALMDPLGVEPIMETLEPFIFLGMLGFVRLVPISVVLVSSSIPSYLALDPNFLLEREIAHLADSTPYTTSFTRKDRSEAPHTPIGRQNQQPRYQPKRIGPEDVNSTNDSNTSSTASSNDSNSSATDSTDDSNTSSTASSNDSNSIATDSHRD